MLNLKITNSKCQLTNQKSSTDRALGELLSYKDKNIEFSLINSRKELKRLRSILGSRMIKVSNNSDIDERISKIERNVKWQTKKLFISLYKKGEFPTGLLPKVIEYLDYSKLQYEIEDTRIKPKKQHKFILKNSLPPLRYYQKTAARRLEEEGRGIVVMPTGSGKSLTMCKMIWDLGVTTLVVTPSKAITDMMADTLVHFFGKGKVSKLDTKSKKLNKINVVNYQALYKISPKVLEKVDAVFIDEFHHSASTTIREINLKHLKNCYYRIGVTATNFRNDGADLALESVLSNVLYEYPISQAIDDGFLVQPEFVSIKTNVRDERTWQQTYKTWIVENDQRNLLITDLAVKYKDKQVLILVQHVEHGQTLSDNLGCDFLHGKVKDSDRQRIMKNYRSGKIKLLIGTSVIGEGVDLPCAEVLIMAGGGKAKSQVMQNVGRVLRIHPGKERALVIDFTDEGSKWLSEHSRLRREVYSIY